MSSVDHSLTFPGPKRTHRVRAVGALGLVAELLQRVAHRRPHLVELPAGTESDALALSAARQVRQLPDVLRRHVLGRGRRRTALAVVLDHCDRVVGI